MRVPRLAVAAAAVALAAAPAAAQPLTFEGVATNAAGFNSAPFVSLGGYTFENFGVATTASFGTGANASSGTKFAYAFAGFGSSFVYRTDVRFNVVSAALSFRRFDGNVAPAAVTVRGYRGSDAVFSTVLTVGNTASVFAINALDIEELEFETSALDAGRSAVLAVDDLALAAVPEPATVVLVGAGGVVLAAVARRRRQAA
jgi:hypothetical protein